MLSCMEMCGVRSMHIPQLIVQRDEMPGYRETTRSQDHTTYSYSFRTSVVILQYCHRYDATHGPLLRNFP